MRQRRKVGDIVQVDLGGGEHGYARVLEHASFAFYDIVTKENASAEEIVGRPVLFIIAVMNKAVTSGRWQRVHWKPLEAPLQRLPAKFMEDAMCKGRYRLYLEDGTMRPATREDCKGLERAAVWDPTHAEERLHDHFAGKPNRWVEMMRLDRGEKT
jgi:hypothetical protein